MKKFFLLLKKEIKEMLTPQLWVPFFAVIVVFFAIGKISTKQISQQSETKDTIAMTDLDQSNLSQSSVQIISDFANVVDIQASDANDFVAQMKDKKIATGIFIPIGFESNLKAAQKTQIETYSLMNNFSVLAGKKLAITDVSTTAINGFISDNLINSKIGLNQAADIKNPIKVQSYVSANGKIEPGNPSQLLGYILSQTTSIPIVLFVVIVMASQMIAAAVATEKENKTLETLLSLPISRRAIVTSKMLSAGLVSLLMAGIYLFGIRSFNSRISGMAAGVAPAQATQDAGQIAQALGLKITTFGFVELGVILFLAILLALAIAMILGAFSEDAKSAQGVVAPLMILVMIPYFITLFLDVSTLSSIVRYIIYAIPFTHVFLAVPNILQGNHLVIAAGAIYMLILFIVFVLIAAKIFSSDLILTMKLNFSKKKNS